MELGLEDTAIKSSELCTLIIRGGRHAAPALSQQMPRQVTPAHFFILCSQFKQAGRSCEGRAQHTRIKALPNLDTGPKVVCSLCKIYQVLLSGHGQEVIATHTSSGAEITLPEVLVFICLYKLDRGLFWKVLLPCCNRGF